MTSKNKGGRPEHEPTDALRKTVESLAAFGVPYEDIATHLGISKNTLKKHYAAALDVGSLKANSKVAQTLFEKATSKGCTGPSVAAAIFWLKARAGWRTNDTGRAEEDAPGAGGPIGKKEKAAQEALRAGQGSEWGDDLGPPATALRN